MRSSAYRSPRIRRVANGGTHDQGTSAVAISRSGLRTSENRTEFPAQDLVDAGVSTCKFSARRIKTRDRLIGVSVTEMGQDDSGRELLQCSELLA